MDERVDVEPGAEPGVVRVADEGEPRDVEKHLEHNQEHVEPNPGTLPPVGVDAGMVRVLGYEKVVGHFVGDYRAKETVYRGDCQVLEVLGNVVESKHHEHPKVLEIHDRDDRH